MDAVRDEPAQQVTEWLSKFGDALARGDSAAAVDLFDADSYWRDLVSFTWNIKTLEGKRIAAACWHHAAVSGPAAGVEAARPAKRARSTSRDDAARGGLSAQRRQMLDAAHDDDRAQGLRGAQGRAARQGGRARRAPGPQDLARATPGRGRHARLHRAALCRHRRRRAGRHRARRASAPAGRADHHRREERTARATPGASATRGCACTTRSGTTTCPTCRSRTTGRCSRRRTRSATGSRCTPR